MKGSGSKNLGMYKDINHDNNDIGCEVDNNNNDSGNKVDNNFEHKVQNDDDLQIGNKNGDKDKNKCENEVGNKPKNYIQEKVNQKMPINNDFDYSIIENLLKDADEKKENIILLTTGSFNPIHRMHLEILNIAYNFLLKMNKYNVLCGFISPSADCYVKHKKPPTIPFDLRCKMINLAIKENSEENKEDNFKIFLHPWEGSHNYFIDFPEVTCEIQKRLSKYHIRLVYVCGMDHFIKCRYSFNKNVIAVDRQPFQNKRYSDIPKNFIYLIQDKNCKSYSSTAIREYFHNGDLENIKKVTFSGVADMVIDFYDRYYQSQGNKSHK